VAFGSRKGDRQGFGGEGRWDCDVFHGSGERCELRRNIASLIAMVSRLMSEWCGEVVDLESVTVTVLLADTNCGLIRLGRSLDRKRRVPLTVRGCGCSMLAQASRD
jgi:hypothetical protein